MNYKNHQDDQKCIEYNNFDVNKLCHTKCFEHNDIKLTDVCDECIIKFYDNNEEMIYTEINNNNNRAMYFAGYVCDIKNDHDEMLQYYLMAIYPPCRGHDGELHSNDLIRCEICSEYDGNSDAMSDIACYYFTSNDDDNVIKYNMMALKKGNIDCMNNLGLYYEKKGDYDNMIKYYLMAIENNDVNAIDKILEKYDCVNLYFWIDNKQFLIENITNENKNKINNILLSMCVRMCESCFMEKECYLRNDLYFCDECY